MERESAQMRGVESKLLLTICNLIAVRPHTVVVEALTAETQSSLELVLCILMLLALPSRLPMMRKLKASFSSRQSSASPPQNQG